MMNRMLLALVLGGLCPVPIAAQEADSAGPKQPTRLFRDNRTLDVTILADFKQLFKDRDTTREERIPARLWYQAPEGDIDSMTVELATRGHSRLKKGTCDFPPIRVYLPVKEARPKLFSSQGSLKLVVTCKPSRPEYQQFVLEEYLIYPIYNLFTDLSLRARQVRATYLQADTPDTVAAGPAFFIEDVDDMAKRNNGEVFEQAGVRFGDVDEETMALVGVFNYMVGNTDWSLQVLHNIRVLKIPPGLYYPMPYDWDFSGIIKTPYAAPDPQLPIRSVRERLYRGACYEMPVFEPVFAKFRQHKDTIYAMYRGLEGLDPKRAEDAIKYLEDFYKTLDNPKKIEGELRYICRG